MYYQRYHRLFFVLVMLIAGLEACSSETLQTETGCPENSPGLAKSPLRGEELESKQLSFVFLGGPSDVSDDIANYLISRNIPATFFMRGGALKDHKAIAAQISNAGYLVGNYGYSGQDLLASRAATTEVRATDLLLLPYIKGNRFLFAPPSSGYDERLRRLLNDAGLNKYVGPIMPITDILGDRFRSDEQCWQAGESVTSCGQNYLEAIESLERGILAFHDTSELSLALLQELIPTLESDSYTFVSLQDIPSINFSLRAAGANLNPDNKPTCNDYE